MPEKNCRSQFAALTFLLITNADWRSKFGKAQWPRRCRVMPENQRLPPLPVLGPRGRPRNRLWPPPSHLSQPRRGTWPFPDATRPLPEGFPPPQDGRKNQIDLIHRSSAARPAVIIELNPLEVFFFISESTFSDFVGQAILTEIEDGRVGGGGVAEDYSCPFLLSVPPPPPPPPFPGGAFMNEVREAQISAPDRFPPPPLAACSLMQTQ